MSMREVAAGSRIGFVGLGVMGCPMAVNLVRAGFEVVGYSRSGRRAGILEEAGGRTASSVAEAVQRADLVITMLPDSPDVVDVLGGEDGVLARLPRGTVVIDFSTIHPEVAMDLAAEGESRGLAVLDAPVSGGEQGAIDGTLSVMVGGDRDAFGVAEPVFGAVGTTVVHVGPSGSGQTVKAANQLIVAGTLELLAEAIVFLEAHGVEMVSALEAIGGGLAGSAVLERKGPAMLARSFAPGFRVELHDKDLRILTTAASAVGAIIPLGAVVAQLMASLEARGDGDLDHSALLKLIEELSGR